MSKDSSYSKYIVVLGADKKSAVKNGSYIPFTNLF